MALGIFFHLLDRRADKLIEGIELLSDQTLILEVRLNHLSRADTSY